MTRFNTQFDHPFPEQKNVRWNFDPVPGFQEHACEPISVMLQRYAAGEDVVRHFGSDFARENYFEDDFAAIDRLQEMEMEQYEAMPNSEFSDSGSEPAPALAQEPDNPGDSEIGPGEASGS